MFLLPEMQGRKVLSIPMTSTPKVIIPRPPELKTSHSQKKSKMWAAGSQGEHLLFLRHSQGIFVLGRGQAAAPAGGCWLQSLPAGANIPPIYSEGSEMLGRPKNSTGFAVVSRAGTEGSVSVHCWAWRRGDCGPQPSRNADRAADTAGHSHTNAPLAQRAKRQK